MKVLSIFKEKLKLKLNVFFFKIKNLITLVEKQVLGSFFILLKTSSFEFFIFFILGIKAKG
jgi:hypothetical protein